MSLLYASLVFAAVLVPLQAQAAPGDIGVFSTICKFSHANDDDPIVYKGLQGAAHHHNFFGNVSTNYRTTTKSLENNATNCDRPEDPSGYWVPALYSDGVELPFEAVHVYYRNTANSDKTLTVPFPRGLRMIAGTSAHSEPPPGSRTAEWACLGTERVVSDDFPDTCPGQKVIATITFPTCWDGVHLTSTDQSHMKYAWENTARPRSCPSSHPVVVPEITEWVRYYVRKADMTGLTLASGDGNSMHADFWNAWDETELQRLVDECLLAGRTCGTVGDGPF